MCDDASRGGEAACQSVARRPALAGGVFGGSARHPRGGVCTHVLPPLPALGGKESDRWCSEALWRGVGGGALVVVLGGVVVTPAVPGTGALGGGDGSGAQEQRRLHPPRVANSAHPADRLPRPDAQLPPICNVRPQRGLVPGAAAGNGGESQGVDPRAAQGRADQEEREACWPRVPGHVGGRRRGRRRGGGRAGAGHRSAAAAA